MAENTPTHPRPHSPARTPTRIALVILLLAGLLGTAYSWRLMLPLDGELREAATDESGESLSPHGIIDWEFAFSADQAERIVTSWRARKNDRGESLLSLATRSVRLDSGLIGSYFLTLTALCLLVAGAFPPGRRRVWLGVSALPTLAALLDVTENILLAKQLAGFYEFAPWASLAASAKFTLLAATAIALVIVGFAWLGKWLSKPSTRLATPLSQVVAAEGRYLEQRREIAGISARSHRLGLALSGGGIRSATINLGVLQALAKRGVLPQFDYLSTVSGGGYIGSALSSLLSINGSRTAGSPQGAQDQYIFEVDGDKRDKAWFSTSAERFPFNEDDRSSGREAGQKLTGAAQMRHLRAAGEFLVGRRQLFSVEMLRTIGSVLAGILYHLLHFGLLMIALAAGYLWVVYLMVGVRATRFAVAGVEGELFEEYGQFVGQAFGFTIEWGLGHPFPAAATVGFVTMALTLGLARRLLPRLPDGWFARPGLTLGRSRNLTAVFAMLLTMLLVGFGLAGWVRYALPDNLLNISIPLVSYLGGGAWLGLLHGWVKARHGYRRQHRSRLAAQEGAFVVLALVSLVLVLLILPFLVFFDLLVGYILAWPLGSLFGWLLTLLGARMFAEGEPEEGARGRFSRLLAAFPGLRKMLLSVIVFIAVLGGLMLICVLIWRFEPQAAPGSFRLTVALAATALFMATGYLFNFNRLALHYFYRDRLAEAYLRTTAAEPGRANALRVMRNNEALRLQHLHGNKRGGQPEECVTSAPYHLVVSCLNLGADQRPTQATRKTDQFVFSRLYCGSETTGYLESGLYRDGETDLAAAMTISGAAASPAMGRATFFAQSLAMTLFNVRLGQWLENPAFEGGTRPRATFWPPYLLQEIFASCAAAGRLVYLSDGGHSGDNLGIYPLLKRRCRLILAIDAEHDPLYSGNSLVEALRQIRIDEGVKVDIDLTPLRPQAGGTGDGRSAAHFVSGRIDYPRKEAETEAESLAASTGWLVVVKSSLTGDEPELIANYRRANEGFPHQTTGDLFFDDAQFEAYRQLGGHMVSSMLDTSPVCRSELRAVPTTP